MSETEKNITPSALAPQPSGSKSTEIPREIRAEIVDLHHKGYGTRRIAPRVGYGRKIVRRILREEGRLHLQPQQPQASKLDPFRTSIERKVTQKLTTSRILREIRQMGYQGKRTVLAEYVRELRTRISPNKNSQTVKRRFETRPGEEIQIDWSPYVVPIAGNEVLVHALGCLLCFSRKLFVYFFGDERQSTLLEGLAMAFEYFDGCCVRLVLDNMSTAVLGRYAVNGKPLWHDRFLDFTRHYGLEPFACKVQDPDRKGKKEKSFRLLWDDFLKASSFESIDELNQRAHIWLDHTEETANQRVHQTTRRVPNEAYLSERDLLVRLPDKRFPVYDEGTRMVDADSTLSVRGTCYSVPSHLANRAVVVHLFAEHFEVLDRHQRLAFSRRYVPQADKGKLVIDETHYATRRRRPRRGDQRLDQAFLLRFPSLAPLVSGLQRRMKALAPVHFRALLRLAESYGQQDLLAAATRAQEHRRFDALAVGRILERDHGPADEEPVAPLGGVGPLIVGDLEPGSLDAYAHLDSLSDQSDCPDEED